MALRLPLNIYFATFSWPDYVRFTHIQAKFAVIWVACIVTIGVNNGLAYDWRDIAKKTLQKDEG